MVPSFLCKQTLQSSTPSNITVTPHASSEDRPLYRHNTTIWGRDARLNLACCKTSVKPLMLLCSMSTFELGIPILKLLSLLCSTQAADSLTGIGRLIGVDMLRKSRDRSHLSRLRCANISELLNVTQGSISLTFPFESIEVNGL